ncbi:cytochrome P450 4C1-like [Epargyreus clarus]|uniref:cytochrome P450 4C1-like n=1 Tax=Epargyreus clarus TaxID=520877 RepID=UPI003C2EB21D
MIWSFLAIAVLLTSFWLRWRYRNRRLLEMAKSLPGPTPLPFIGNAHMFMGKPEELIIVIRELIKTSGDVSRFWLGPDLNIVVSDPDEIKVLLSNPKTSFKGPQYKYMADVIGDGILSGSGVAWRKHRKIATPNYGKKAIESYEDIFNEEVDYLLAKFREVPTGKQINIYNNIVQTTSYAVCRTLMGLSREETLNLPHLQSVIDLSPRMYDIVFKRMTKWYLQLDPVFWFSNLNTSLKGFVSIMNELSAAILRNRLKKLETIDKNKLDLMNADDDSLKNTQLSVIDRFLLSQELNYQELVHETFTIFTSSQEASAKISSYLLLMMAYHPECQEKLYNEILSVMGDEDRPVTDEDLKQMHYLEMAFKEVLRLFPIGAMLQRTITEDITINSGVLPAGSSLLVPVYHIHRDSRFWTNPDAFDPERFSPENTRLRRPNCYIPFSLGPMDCLGRYFGTKLIKTICVRMMREFKLTSSETYTDLKVVMAISVASVNGFPVILSPRKQGK